MGDTPTPDQEVRRLYEEAEAQTGKAMERLVGRQAFGELLAMATENTVAVIKLWSDAADLVVRNLRLAGRRDLVRLGKQIARTEDKLERVLQEVEQLRGELRAPRDGAGAERGDGSPRSSPRQSARPEGS
jgi:hypothetical protein